MNVLAMGMEWPSQIPGGLNRYFADYVQAWREGGGNIHAIVRSIGTASSGAPEYVSNVNPKSSSPSRMLLEWRKAVREELATGSYDILNTHFAYYASSLAGMHVGVPLVTNFQGPWAYEYLMEANSSSFKRELKFTLMKSIERYVYHKSHQLIVLSHDFRDVLTRRYGVPAERVHVIPAAVDTRRFTISPDVELERSILGLPTDRMILLSVRRLAKRMGLERLVYAMATLRVDFPDLLLVIVGGGMLLDELQSLVNRLELHNHVILTGRVTEEQLPLYYRIADLTVVPSIALEGFGLTTIESMASGTPVAGTPIGGTKEILGEFCTELLFNGIEIDDIVEGLGRILANKARLPRREQMREVVLNRYTWDAVIVKMQRVFNLALQ